MTIRDQVLRHLVEVARAGAAIDQITRLERLAWDELPIGRSFEPVRSLAGLEACRSLVALILGPGNSVSDLSPLAALTQLEELRVQDSITSLEPLRGMPALKDLQLADNRKLRDLSPLTGLAALERLDLSKCDVVDLSPLRACERLKELTLFGNTALELAPGSANLDVVVELLGRACTVRVEDAKLDRAAALRAADVGRERRVAAAGDLASVLRAEGASEIADLYGRSGLSATKDARSLLALAASAWLPRVVRALLEAGAVPTLADLVPALEIPYDKGASTGDGSDDAEMCRLLLDAGLDANGDGTIRPLAIAAASTRRRAIVELLVARGASLREPHAFVTLCREYPDLALRGLEAGADPNAAVDHATALENAARGGHVDLVKALLARGAAPNHADNTGARPLHAATSPEIIDCLLGAGADIDATDDGGATALIRVASFPSAVLHLLSRGADPTIVSRAGRTVVHELVTSLRSDRVATEVLSKLLERGVPLDAKDVSGKTPAQLAFEPSVKNAIRTLIKDAKAAASAKAKAKKGKGATGKTAAGKGAPPPPEVPAPLARLRELIAETPADAYERIEPVLWKLARVAPLPGELDDAALWPCLDALVRDGLATGGVNWAPRVGYLARLRPEDPLTPFAVLELAYKHADAGEVKAAGEIVDNLSNSQAHGTADAYVYYLAVRPAPFKKAFHQYLARVGGPSHVAALIEGLGEGVTIGNRCAKRLVELGAEVVPALRAASAHKKTAVRARVTQLLEKLQA